MDINNSLKDDLKILLNEIYLCSCNYFFYHFLYSMGKERQVLQIHGVNVFPQSTVLTHYSFGGSVYMTNNGGNLWSKKSNPHSIIDISSTNESLSRCKSANIYSSNKQMYPIQPCTHLQVFFIYK